MKILEIEQYTLEWWAARAGMPTASGADKIITPGGKQTTRAKRDDYQYDLIASWLSKGKSDNDNFTSYAMQRGTELEPKAREEFAFMMGLEVREVGFCISGEIGCSPDGMIGGDDGSILEIKCPMPKTHAKYLIENKVPQAYYPQLQFQMLVCERSYSFFMSYSPWHEPVIVRCDADIEYMDKLANYLDEFIEELDTIKSGLSDRDIVPQ